MLPNKVCPVVVRMRGALEILAFRHPRAGLQLVKGTIEAGEAVAAAAIRELKEEAGIEGRVVADLGVWRSDYEGQRWAMLLCVVDAPLPDTWTHHAADDGGHDFAFFWQPLMAEPDTDFHAVFQRAIRHLRKPVPAALLQLAMADDREPTHD